MMLLLAVVAMLLPACTSGDERALDGAERLRPAERAPLGTTVDRGERDEDGEYPAVVAVLHGPAGYLPCSGIVVGPRTVITAAHCLTDEVTNRTKCVKPSHVYLGLDVRGGGSTWDVANARCDH